MKIGLFQPKVEPTAAKSVAKQDKLNQLQKTVFGRFIAKSMKAIGVHVEMADRLKMFKSELKERNDDQATFIDYLCRNPEKASKLLTLSEQYAVYTYAKEGYEGMNGALRNPHSPARKDVSYFDNLNKVATEALKKISASQEGFTLTFRGLHGDMPHAKLAKGEIYTEKAFVSTSKSASVIKGGFNRKVDGYSGTSLYTFGKSGANISNVAVFDGEEEVLYKPNTQFRVVFSQKDHEATIPAWGGRKVTTKTNHVVLEEANTPADKGHSGILNGLDLADGKASIPRPRHD